MAYVRKNKDYYEVVEKYKDASQGCPRTGQLTPLNLLTKTPNYASIPVGKENEGNEERPELPLPQMWMDMA